MPFSYLTIDSLYHKSTQELLAIWTDVVGQTPRCTSAREFLLLGLAWQLQAQQCGGLALSLQRRLKTLQKKVRANDSTHVQNTPSRFQPGTVLVKEWQGRRYTVMVQDRGFAYNGTTYQSLSAIARLITGTRWNGPVFFGLRQSSQKKTQ